MSDHSGLPLGRLAAEFAVIVIGANPAGILAAVLVGIIAVVIVRIARFHIMGVALVSDCTAALEVSPEAARLGDRPVRVEDGAVRLPDGTLAGSALTMERAVENMVSLAGARWPDAASAASSVPAALVGAGEVGALAAGRLADLVLYGEDGRLRRILIGGAEVEDG